MGLLTPSVADFRRSRNRTLVSDDAQTALMAKADGDSVKSLDEWAEKVEPWETEKYQSRSIGYFLFVYDRP